MFATLRNYKHGDSLYIHRVGSSSGHQACNSCRMRKLKCTGELNGCQRCQMRNAQCEYPELHQNKERKRSKTQNANSRENNTLPTTAPRPHALSRSSPSSPAPTESTAPERSTNHHTKQIEPTVGGSASAVDLVMLYTEDNQVSGLARIVPNIGIWNGCSDASSFTGDFSIDAHRPHSKDKTDDRETIDTSSRDENGIDIDWNLDSFESNDALLPDWPHSSYMGELPALQSSSPDLEFAKAGNGPLALSPNQNPAEPRLQSPNLTSKNDELFKNDVRTTNAQCKCILSGLSALEALETENLTEGHQTIDKELRFQKSMLVYCNQLLDCSSCNSISSFMMLVVVLLQKTTTSFERIVREVIGHRRLHRPMTSSSEGSMIKDFPERSASDFQLSPKPRLFIRDYEVDEQDEYFVFVGLVARQLNMLLALLSRLNKLGLKSNLRTHCFMLDALEKRTQVQQKVCSDFQ